MAYLSPVLEAHGVVGDEINAAWTPDRLVDIAERQMKRIWEMGRAAV